MDTGLTVFLMSVNVVILVRVSTRDQKVDRQISDLEAFSQKQGWTVTEVIASQVSGSKVNYQQREDLVKLQSPDRVLPNPFVSSY